MLEIFKYFIGIIGVLILAYVLIVVIRTVLITGFSTGKEVVASTTVSQSVASGTVSVVDAIKGFSFTTLSDWLLNHRLVTVSPIYVGYDQQNAGYSFFGNNEGKGFKTQEQLYWQNLNDAPNAHPTDWVPVGKSYYQTLLNNSDQGENNNELTEEDAKIEVKYIRPNLSNGEILSDNTVITGREFYKVFSQRVFPIYILDTNGNTVGAVKAFANSDIGQDEFVTFRAVLDLDKMNMGNSAQVYLLFKNENFEMSKIKAVNVVPVILRKQNRYYYNDL